MLTTTKEPNIRLMNRGFEELCCNVHSESNIWDQDIVMSTHILNFKKMLVTKVENFYMTKGQKTICFVNTSNTSNSNLNCEENYLLYPESFTLFSEANHSSEKLLINSPFQKAKKGKQLKFCQPLKSAQFRWYSRPTEVVLSLLQLHLWCMEEIGWLSQKYSTIHIQGFWLS